MRTWRISAALNFLALPLALYGRRQYRALLPLPSLKTVQGLPMLSVVIPARNEERNLPRILPSLNAACYPGSIEVIVVDDNSSDHTAAIAGKFGAKVISLKELPAGWLGKPHACHKGALAAQGEWLLFVDADTLHAPDGPARVVAHACDQELDGLSLFLGQRYNNWFDQLVINTAFAGLFAGHRQGNALLNGQYILLRRDVYLRSGGFEAVANEPLEDLALGRHLFALGYHVPMMQDESIATVHMYEDNRQMWRGLVRLGAGSLRWTGIGVLPTFLFITAIMTPFVAMIGFLRGGLSWRWPALNWICSVASMWLWRHRTPSTWWVLLAPLGALFVQAAAVWGLVSRRLGLGVNWKNRKV